MIFFNYSKKYIYSFFLCFILFFIFLVPSFAQEKKIPVTIQADIKNGITDNISFTLYRTDLAEFDTMQYNLLRMNKFRTRLQLEPGNYIITNINTYNSNYIVEDIEFTISAKDTSLQVITITVADGSQGEEINTTFSDLKGVPSTPSEDEKEISDDNKEEDISILNSLFSSTKKEVSGTRKKIAYGVLVILVISVFFGYRKLKKLWYK